MALGADGNSAGYPARHRSGILTPPWPILPQLYVEGEFVGGADILVEMAGKGELNPLLQGSS